MHPCDISHCVLPCAGAVSCWEQGRPHIVLTAKRPMRANSQMTKRVQRFVVISDSHGSEADTKAVAAMLDFVKAFKPTIRVHAGDLFDFACLRRNASDQERRQPIRDDIDAGLTLLADFKPTHFLRGNHDERLWDLLKSDDGNLRDVGNEWVGQIEKSLCGVHMLPYDKRKGVLKLGPVSVIHGYHTGLNAVRAAAQIWGNVLMGHIHAIDSASVPGVERRVGRAIGCLCHLDYQYNRAQANTLRQAHGWAYGFLTSDSHQTFQAESLAGSWYFPTEFRECRPT